MPIVFPPSLIGLDNRVDDENNVTNYQINFSDLFKSPAFDELDKLARDDTGERKKLTKDQLESIRKNGYFDVESAAHPGKYHRWELTKCLQNGYANTNSTFFSNMADALKMLIVTPRNRLSNSSFSVLEGLKSWRQSLVDLVDIFIGLPSLSVVSYDAKLSDELRSFLIAELSVDVSS